MALEVGDVDEAVAFYGRVFEVELRGRVHGMAFLDMGDQFLALSQSEAPSAGPGAHFGLVVEDRARVRKALQDARVEVEPGRGLHFRDPWGNLVEVVQYSEVQFTKAPEVLGGMGLEGLGKSESAQKELREKGLAG
ncbi:MAG TPA: VOC family protein [Thermoleophilaceae bacterium]|nr:VOC family protein [Thermoleophilaceae bacterium]